MHDGDSPMTPTPVSIADKFALFSEPWSPKRVGRVDDHDVRLVRLQGEFHWHHHADADEMFLVVAGLLRMHFRDRYEDVAPGSFIIVPKGVEHKPEAFGSECQVVLFEKAEVVNTGDGVVNARTVADPEYI
jgi:mannose-6-phosphate isomerase-like protein (cupin superfamily)